ncbi:MAG TPA: acyl carrier protein [Candidatus Nanoarchaeia archaeon]|nr:acyl carrier protein [Candidatus Nanoarchaeia archaeon]
MESLKAIMASVLGIKQEKLNDNFSRDNSEEWDSFNHLMLMSEIEKKTGIKFTIKEIESIKSFKNLKDTFEKKAKAK